MQKQLAGGLSSLHHGHQFARAGGMEGSELDPPPAPKGRCGRKKKVRRGKTKSTEIDPKLSKTQRKRNRRLAWPSRQKEYTSGKDGEEGESSEDSVGVQNNISC